jgi:hypothetical protein
MDSEFPELQAFMDEQVRKLSGTASLDPVAELVSVLEWMKDLPIPSRGCRSNMERLRNVINVLEREREQK